MNKENIHFETQLRNGLLIVDLKNQTCTHEAKNPVDRSIDV